MAIRYGGKEAGEGREGKQWGVGRGNGHLSVRGLKKGARTALIQI